MKWALGVYVTNSCKETHQMKRDFTHLSSKYNDLLSELSKTKSLLKDKSMHKEEFDATLSCKQCDSKELNYSH